jgi:peroxiredoxin
MKILLLVVALGFGSFAHAQDSVWVYGTIKNGTRDTVKCVLNENFIIRQTRTFYLPVTNGSFRISIPLRRPSYFYLNEGANYVNGIVAPGDRIGITYDAGDMKSTLEISGKAKEKFEWTNALVAAKLTSEILAQAKIAKDKPYPFDYLFSFFDSTRDYYLARLQKIQHIDSVSAYLLRSQLEGSIQLYKYSGVTNIFKEHIEQTLESRASQLTPASRMTIENFLKFREDYHSSPLYLNAIYNLLHRQYNDRVYNKKMPADLAIKYRYLDSLLPGKLKVPVLTMFFEADISQAAPSSELLSLIDQTFANSSDPVYQEYIQAHLARTHFFKKGMKAPDFQLENEKGEKVSLASFRGKVIYMDFWFGACGPCHSLFFTTKSAKEYFKNNDQVVFLTVSVDDKEIWKQSLKKFNIQGYHVYTENRERRHPVINDYRVSGYPTTFLIDKTGNIFMAAPSGNPDELKAQITEALK